MARTKVDNLRLTEMEWEELVADAELEQVWPAEVLRDYIKTLNKKPS